jgi:copper chaperone CopZ
MDKLEFQASKIKCGGCVSTVTNGLKELNGITEINVDIPTNIVSVSGDNLDKAAIENKLSELGYPVI